MCATCPFRPNSKYADLRPDLELSAQREASRICHSTGSNNAINRRTGLREHLCRGARDVQLDLFFSLGVIDEASDEAWNASRVKFGMKEQLIQDPIKRH
jgi:hypothetical protein